MTAVARSAILNKLNPVLDVFVHRAGVLETPYTLAFQIFDVSTDAKMLAPTQVYPTIPGQEQLVDLVASKLGDGHFAATWTVGASEAYGRHRIVWYAALDAGGFEYSTSVDFDVLEGFGASGHNGQRGYALVSDLRDEGFTATMISNARAIAKIESASRTIDRFTRQFFEPRELTLKLDGARTAALAIDFPILSIKSVEFTDYEGAVDMTALAVYNRHIAQGLTLPDDRRNPKIEWSHSSSIAWGRSASTIFDSTSTVWREGTANIEVAGVFGFTEPFELSIGAQVSAFFGRTPEAIKRAVMLLVVRDMAKLSRPEDRFEDMNRHRIRSEATRDQNYTLGPGRADSGGAWTGDPEIDGIIADHLAPLRIGST
jgi:hypothetical protein